jgi:hypothetical protein
MDEALQIDFYTFMLHSKQNSNITAHFCVNCFQLAIATEENNIGLLFQVQTNVVCQNLHKNLMGQVLALGLI